MSSFSNWFRNNQIFFNYAMLGISAAYMGWAYTLEIPRWALMVMWFFNPLTIYGAVIMYVRRDALFRAYDMFSGFWALRSYEKKYGRVELDEEDKQ